VNQPGYLRLKVVGAAAIEPATPMNQKYADVVTLAESLEYLDGLRPKNSDTLAEVGLRHASSG